MYDPDNGWRPWPEPSSYDPAWLAALPRRPSATGWRASTTDARAALAEREAGAAPHEPPSGARRRGTRARRAPCTRRYLTTYRTLADPAYLDPTIDPDDRPLGSVFAFPDPLDANYGYGGLARVMTARGWLSTWSGLSARTRRWPTTLPRSPCRPCSCTRPATPRSASTRRGPPSTPPAPTTRPTSRSRARAHYFTGRQRDALEPIIDWLRDRFPTT